MIQLSGGQQVVRSGAPHAGPDSGGQADENCKAESAKCTVSPGVRAGAWRCRGVTSVRGLAGWLPKRSAFDHLDPIEKGALVQAARIIIQTAIATIMTFSVSEMNPRGTLLSPPTQAHFRSRFSM